MQTSLDPEDFDDTGLPNLIHHVKSCSIYYHIVQKRQDSKSFPRMDIACVILATSARFPIVCSSQLVPQSTHNIEHDGGQVTMNRLQHTRNWPNPQKEEFWITAFPELPQFVQACEIFVKLIFYFLAILIKCLLSNPVILGLFRRISVTKCIFLYGHSHA